MVWNGKDTYLIQAWVLSRVSASGVSNGR